MLRIFRIASIVVHLVVVTVVLVAQLLAVGPLPVPHSPLTFVGMMPIAITEPPPPRSNVPQGNALSSTNAAPIVSPEGVTPETPNPPRTAPAIVSGVDGAVPGFGAIDLAPPPAAPPPPPAPPRTPVHLHAGMQAPRKTLNVDPVYPRVAQAAHIEGVVILEAIIDAQGRVTAAHVLRSIPLLDQAAIDAVQRWTFTPALLNGEAVPVVMTVTVNFKLTSDR